VANSPKFLTLLKFEEVKRMVSENGKKYGEAMLFGTGLFHVPCMDPLGQDPQKGTFSVVSTSRSGVSRYACNSCGIRIRTNNPVIPVEIIEEIDARQKPLRLVAQLSLLDRTIHRANMRMSK
jgi:hypothetical protein